MSVAIEALHELASRGAPDPSLADVLDACHAIERASFTTPTLDLRDELRRSFTRAWAARLEPAGPVVGFLLAWHVADELQILTVATLPSARRRGVGGALVDAAMQAAAASRCASAQLEVRRGNAPAIALYRRAGFFVVNVRERYYADDGEDAVLMTARLDPATGAPLPGADDPHLD